MSFIYIMSFVLVGINLLNAWLFFRNAREIDNGRRLVRLFSVFVGLFAVVVYSLVVFGFFPNGLPPEWGRPLTTLYTVDLFGLAVTEYIKNRLSKGRKDG